MYDYQRKLDYYNYTNNNYNKPMFSENESPKTVLDPAEWKSGDISTPPPARRSC